MHNPVTSHVQEPMAERWDVVEVGLSQHHGRSYGGESNLREVPPSVLLWFKTFRFKIASAGCQQATGRTGHIKGQRIYKPIRGFCIKS